MMDRAGELVSRKHPRRRYWYLRIERLLLKAILSAILSALILSSAAASDEFAERELETLQRDLKPKASSKPKVLDFEADIIEGERKLPSLFLQMEIESPNLDAVVYRRKNFNEFHVLEVDRKPLYKRPD